MLRFITIDFLQVYVKQYLAEHESQVVLWEQMTTFRREFIEMRSQVESILTRLHMDFSNMTREASCNFVLLLSQMGCPSCSSGVRKKVFQSIAYMVFVNQISYRVSLSGLSDDFFRFLSPDRPGGVR